MAPVQYTGSLQPKKKSELQEIAQALNLSDQGTKDDIQARIKKHLDDNQSQLEDDPVFAGLFGRRKRSVQPQPPPTREPVVSEQKLISRLSRRPVVLDPVQEATPAKDLRDVSAYLKHPISPVASTPDHSPRRSEDAPTPSSLPPLPPSSPAPVSPVKVLIDNLKAPDVAAVVENIKQHDIRQTVHESLVALRHSLSDARNIWFLTASFELLYILYTIIPWQTAEVPWGRIQVIYPPPVTFQGPAFWIVLLHWFIPTILAPVVVGNLISFNPARSQRQLADTKETFVFDPLTASIIRLAAHIAYPYSTLNIQPSIYGTDVLGFKLRVLSASLTLAFAFAETISGAPHAFAQTLRRDRRYLTVSREGTPTPITGPDA
ncbi:hypothetical protein P691DRAFT_757363 [Macrolepiota fuliginosa MF-IS2]|uniref:SAP domain-containing protein n=1 Tax=Macrolepiota fuliginosa MF-IS2 TaxID=1400762 RepID=A0A9P6C4I2_9AGAR|nr:hypothetical protein P691DRAFT_757363 [Macrolepiota fuliginosa MF-IS2]